MMRAFLFSLLLFASAAFAWSQGQAIDVTLRAGEVVSGTLVAETETGLLVRSTTGTRLIRFDDIAQVRASGVAPSPSAPVALVPTPAPSRKQEIIDQRIEARKRAQEEAEAENRDPTLRRTRFSIFIEPSGGVGAGIGVTTDSVRCFPCVKESVLGAFNLGGGVSLAIPLSDLFWVRASLAGFWRGGPYRNGGTNGGAQLGGEFFVAPTSRFSFGFGGQFGFSFPNGIFGPVMGLVATPLSWRFSAHHRLSIPVQVSVTWSTAEGDRDAPLPYLFEYPQTFVWTEIGFFGGLQYEIQF